MPGVTVVHDGNFVGVAAPNESEAIRAVAAIRAEWKTPPQPSGREIFDYLKKNSTGGDDRSGHSVGSMEEGLAAADKKLAQNYTVAYIAHAPLNHARRLPSGRTITHRVDRLAAPFWSTLRTRERAADSGDERASHRSGYGFRIRRQTFR